MNEPSELDSLIGQLSKRFGEELEMKGVLFLIGVQELGKGFRKYSKDEKIDIIHIAVCTLLEGYGYYEFIGRDEEGWPHWKSTEKLPFLKPGEQDRLIRLAVLEYFRKNPLSES